MKTILLIVFACAFQINLSLGQAPVPESDTVDNPIQQGDPALKTMPQSVEYAKDLRQITEDEIPNAVKKALKKSPEYGGWQSASLFRDDNKDEYVIEFRETGAVRTYRFSKQGELIVEK
jgi:hypothetical protein